jgi:thymidine phosphorylase
VRAKIQGHALSAGELGAIVQDIAHYRYSDMEIAAFLIGSASFMTSGELLALSRAMAEAGTQLKWDRPIVVDKHCIGGIPGNRTSMLVVPIVAAHGMVMPKTSSRAITSPSGTADTMEVLAKVELEPEQLYNIVHQERACLAWGGTARLAPADDVLISVERPLGIDSQGQMVASILSKKLAAGSNHLLVDIPVGPTAKVRHMREALQLRKLFEYIGDRSGIHLEVIITDGNQPIGRGIGPVLEARDVMQVLNNETDAPSDLRQKALRLAGRILEFDPDVRGGYGYSIARDILDSGRAMAKMQDIIAAQGKQTQEYHLGKLSFEVTAERSGFITAIDNYHLARIARLAGAPMDKGAGVDLFKKLGDGVEQGEPLYRVYAEFKADHQFALAMTQERSGYTIGNEAAIAKSYMEI